MICRNVLTCKRLCLPAAGVLQLHFVPFVIASDQRERGDLKITPPQSRQVIYGTIHYRIGVPIASRKTMTAFVYDKGQ